LKSEDSIDKVLGPKTVSWMIKGKMIRCVGCGAEFSTEEILIAWLEGKIPNTISCPVCGKLESSLIARQIKVRA
jgi:transcription elongation factor Elf1